MRSLGRSRARLALAAAATIAMLAAGSTVALAATTGGMGGHRTPRTAGCVAPALRGTTIDVTLSNVPNMMRGGQMSKQSRLPGMMDTTVTPSVAPHGTISLRVHNAGSITHELIILPLADGRPAGTRTVHADGRVSEAGSVGEVSRTCASGAGDGIAAHGTGWTTRTLPAGRYELVCNLPGHYAAGMYAGLTIN